MQHNLLTAKFLVNAAIEYIDKYCSVGEIKWI